MGKDKLYCEILEFCLFFFLCNTILSSVLLIDTPIVINSILHPPKSTPTIFPPQVSPDISAVSISIVTKPPFPTSIFTPTLYIIKTIEPTLTPTIEVFRPNTATLTVDIDSYVTPKTHTATPTHTASPTPTSSKTPFRIQNTRRTPKPTVTPTQTHTQTQSYTPLSSHNQFPSMKLRKYNTPLDIVDRYTIASSQAIDSQIITTYASFESDFVQKDGRLDTVLWIGIIGGAILTFPILLSATGIKRK